MHLFAGIDFTNSLSWCRIPRVLTSGEGTLTTDPLRDSTSGRGPVENDENGGFWGNLIPRVTSVHEFLEKKYSA